MSSTWVNPSAVTCSASGSASSRQRHRAAPRARVHLVDRHRAGPARRVGARRAIQSSSCQQWFPSNTTDAVAGGTSVARGQRIGVLPQAAVGPMDRELVPHPGLDTGDEQLPQPRAAQRSHGQGPVVPPVAVPDDGDAAGARGPHRERRPSHAVQLLGMCTEHAAQLPVPPLTQEVQVEVTERRQEAVRVVVGDVGARRRAAGSSRSGRGRRARARRDRADRPRSSGGSHRRRRRSAQRIPAGTRAPRRHRPDADGCRGASAGRGASGRRVGRGQRSTSGARVRGHPASRSRSVAMLRTGMSTQSGRWSSS